MAPTLIGIGVYYVDVLLGRSILSGLGEGPVSYFGFAMRLCDFPQGIFVMALQAATLPNLAALAARGDREELGKTFAYSMRLALFVGIPATVALAVLAEPIVSLLFQRGHFDAESTRETGHALVAQALGVFLVAGVRQLVAVFFALGQTKTPVLVASLDLLVFVGAAYALRSPLGHFGVGLAVSLASLAQFALLYWFLARTLPRLHGAEVLASSARTFAASAVAGGTSFAIVRWLPISTNSGALLRLIPAPLGLAVFGVVFFAMAHAVGSQELRELTAPVLRRLRRGTKSR
jgi:putative peptidoglycan lipid II flippase